MKGLARARSWLLPRRLVTQVSLLGALLLTATLVAYSWYTAGKQADFAASSMRQQVQALARNLAAASADYLLASDFASLEQLLVKASDFPEVTRIQVSDVTGELVGDIERGPDGTPVVRFGAERLVPPVPTEPVTRVEHKSLVQWHPVIAGTLLGWVKIHYSLELIDHAQTQMWRDTLIAGLFALSAGVALLVLLLRRRMSAIHVATQFAQKLYELKGSQMPVDDSAVEISALADALNDASARLFETAKDLRDQKFALDESSIVSITDVDGRITYVNDTFCQISGYPREDLLRLNQHFLAADFYPEAFFEELWAIIRQGKVWRGELKQCRKDGGFYWVNATIVPFVDQNGKPYQYVAVQTDITERKHVETQRDELSSALEQTADSVIITDRLGVIKYVNRAFGETTGYSADEVIGKTPRLIKSGGLGREFYQRLWGTIVSGRVFRDVFINRKKNGELYYEETTITPLRDEHGEITEFISTGKNITERMQVQEHLQYLAHHDVLTGLPNRVLFLDRLNQAIARARWNNWAVAVLFLDLDRFKVINDTLGHEIGDRLLQAVASRLKKCVREGDTVGRLGGDEFTVLLEDIASQEDVPTVARNIINALSRPMVVDGRELFVTVSIGISVFPGDGADGAELLKNADTAMYSAKEEGRNTFQFYSADMGISAFTRLNLETSLRHAMQRLEFLLHYQPQVDLTTRKVTGVEALLRWRHPELGLVPLDDFIPLLEETGLIIPVGEWVLQTACSQMRAWQQAGLEPGRIAINLSSRQFTESNFAETVASILDETGLDPHCLEIEITESVIMQHTQLTMDTFQTLGALGVRIAIDDFGTGYSSLSYLKRFPIDILKIDRSFVRDVTTDPDDAAIVQAIIAMARSLKLDVIAEGVETQDQLAFLRAQRCDGLQGNLFSPPLPAEDIVPLFQKKLSVVGA